MIKLWLDKVDHIKLDISGSVEETKKILENDYDLIVSDNMLGDGEIKDVIKVIQNSSLKDTPILVYTGTIAKINIPEVKTLGNVVDVLPKPFEMKTFLKLVDEVTKHKS